MRRLVRRARQQRRGRLSGDGRRGWRLELASGARRRCCCTTTSTAGCGRETVIELAAETGYRELPTTDPDELAKWFTSGADRKSLELYLEGFRHTVAVMQTRDAIERVAAECAEDLAADGIVYAEVRMAPELMTDGGLSLDEAVTAMLDGFRRGSEGRPITIGLIVTAMRQAAQVGRDRRARGPAPGRRRRRLRHRRPGGRLSADAAPRRVQPDRPRELPLHDPRRRGLRPAVDLGGAAVVRRRAPRPRRAHRRRHHGAPRRPRGARAARVLRARHARAARDVPDVERPHRAPRRASRSIRSTCCAGCGSASP